MGVITTASALATEPQNDWWLILDSANIASDNND